MKRIKADMGELEGQVMQVIWARGPVTAEAVREQLGRGLKDSTISIIVRGLAGHGIMMH